MTVRKNQMQMIVWRPGVLPLCSLNRAARGPFRLPHDSNKSKFLHKKRGGSSPPTKVYSTVSCLLGGILSPGAGVHGIARELRGAHGVDVVVGRLTGLGVDDLEEAALNIAVLIE